MKSLLPSRLERQRKERAYEGSLEKWNQWGQERKGKETEREKSEREERKSEE